MSARKGSIGFPLFEAMVALALIATFIVVLLDRIAYYSEAAEKAKVELTLTHIRSGLRYVQAKAIISGSYDSLRALDGSNPIKLLDPAPENYIGEVEELRFKSTDRGHWIYEKKSRSLYYFPRNTAHLSAQQKNGMTFLKYVLTSRLRSPDKSEDSDKPMDIVLLAAPPYRWFD